MLEGTDAKSGYFEFIVNVAYEETYLCYMIIVKNTYQFKMLFKTIWPRMHGTHNQTTKTVKTESDISFAADRHKKSCAWST